MEPEHIEEFEGDTAIYEDLYDYLEIRWLLSCLDYEPLNIKVGDTSVEIKLKYYMVKEDEC